MGSVTTRWEDTLHIPSKFAGLVGPGGSNSVGGTLWISLLLADIEEQQLISTTV